MNKIDKNKTTRIIHEMHFDFAEAEVSYTDQSQGGAASNMNDAILFKGKQPKKEDLTQGQEEILDAINEEFSPLSKQKIDKEVHTSSSEDEGAEDNNINKGNTMSDEATVERLAQLEKQVAEGNVDKAFRGYKFEDELNTELCTALSGLDKEGIDLITKAFDAILATNAEAITKAVEAAENGEGNQLQEDLSKEAGNSEEAEGDSPVDMNKAIAANLEKSQGDK